MPCSVLVVLAAAAPFESLAVMLTVADTLRLARKAVRRECVVVSWLCERCAAPYQSRQTS
jgi:hypothetical protein